MPVALLSITLLSVSSTIEVVVVFVDTSSLMLIEPPVVPVLSKSVSRVIEPVPTVISAPSVMVIAPPPSTPAPLLESAFSLTSPPDVVIVEEDPIVMLSDAVSVTAPVTAWMSSTSAMSLAAPPAVSVIVFEPFTSISVLSAPSESLTVIEPAVVTS